MITEFDLKVEKMRKYCLFSDRCHRDVRTKLIKDEIYGDELEQIMAILIEENFLNEERFAKAFAIGKFRQNKWGKKKIEMELKRRNVSQYCIRKGMEEISNDEYAEVIKKLWSKKIASTTAANEYLRKQKVLNYLIQKGFEYHDIKMLV